MSWEEGDPLTDTRDSEFDDEIIGKCLGCGEEVVIDISGTGKGKSYCDNRNCPFNKSKEDWYYDGEGKATREEIPMDREHFPHEFGPSQIGYDPVGWIDTDGQYWDVEETGHEEFAGWYLNNPIQRGDDSWSSNRTRTLMNMGWIRISNGVFILPRKLTDPQTHAMIDWFDANQKEVEIADNYGHGHSDTMDKEKFVEQYGMCVTKFTRLARKIDMIISKL